MLINLEELRTRVAGMRVALCHGCFDPLHLGHIQHFRAAKRRADIDYLCVSITADAFVNKGPNRPLFPAAQRAEAVSALRDVDFVVINENQTCVPVIEALRPRYYFKGDTCRTNPTPTFLEEQAAIQQLGGMVMFTDATFFSSTRLLQDSAPPQILADWLGQINGLKMLVIGENIIDVYVNCETLGKSGKEPILAVESQSTETYDGGALAVAKQLTVLGGQVALITGNGHITKLRYVEQYPRQKLFEVYQPQCDYENETWRAAIQDQLNNAMTSCDLVLIVDYGHGLVTPAMIKQISQGGYLAVNTQTNAGNHGFNTLGRYPRADFFTLSERELRMAARDRRTPIETLARIEARELGAGGYVITRGSQGLLCGGQDGSYLTSPALADHHVDRVGAGDLVFALTAALNHIHAPLEVLGALGNAIGARAVCRTGHRNPVSREDILSVFQSSWSGTE